MQQIQIVSQLDASHLEQLPELLQAATLADGHEPVGEHKFLRLKHRDDLASAVLAYEAGTLVGYAHTLAYGPAESRRLSCELVVHPHARGRGIGRRLLAATLDHASALSASRMDAWAYNDSPASARMATSLGFEPTRRLLHLHRHMRELPRSNAPAGVTLRAFRPGLDDAAWLALNNRVFAGHPENGTWTMDDLRARMAQPWFDAGDLLLAETGDTLAGFCWVKVEERAGEGRVGEIYVIGVAREHRGSGLGRFLLAEGLRRMQARGAGIAAIYVDEANAGGVRLYQSAGFHHHHVDVCYSRDVTVPLPARDEAAA
jgi:mycothiol synthase